jgi:hypothetical protein
MNANLFVLTAASCAVTLALTRSLGMLHLVSAAS